VTNRVIELNPAYPGGHFSVAGPYSRFLEKRAEFLEGQRATERVLANKVRREIEWLEAGPKAQRTKDKARTDAAGRKLAELHDVRERNRSDVTARIEFDATGRQTRKLLVGEGLAKCVGERTLFRDVTVRLTPGYRLGLLGPNGSGKTTLIRVLTGELPPDAGTLQRAENLKLVVFDQKRERLPRGVRVSQALSPEGDYVVFRGQRIHVQGWAQRFLFKPQQLIMTVGELSGGEQARIQIARLMLQPADVLILDEPTNDLDLNALEMLEDNLEQFPGAIILVTHDRFLMDRLCDEILALDGTGGASVYADLSQWQAAREKARAAARSAAVPRRAAMGPPPRATAEKAVQPVRKLSYKDKLELEQMEARIAAAEEHVRACQSAAQDPVVASDHVELARRYAALEAAQAAVDALYARWSELESRGG
jgi:ATP-binding cassette subfamily F protein uup